MARRKTISDEAVLEAAAKVMFAEGPSFTLADVARATGIAPATLVQRFGDKHGLTVAAIARDNRAFEDFLSAAPAGQGAEAVIAIFAAMFDGPDTDADRFADQLLWLRQDMRDPALNRLARERFTALRAAVAARLPPLPIAAAEAARLVEAQWQGVLVQWGIEREGRLSDYVAARLRAWFELLSLSPPQSGEGSAGRRKRSVG
ncbi:MAG TPA: TetR family transcriptional regulator [Caulobacteraceae bacterium]|jgi:AcrR family transcriptional regulator